MQLSLYDLVKLENCCLDTCDDIFDITITINEADDTEKDYCTKFSNFIMKNVNVVGKGSVYIGDWYSLISENLDVFREAANDMWYEESVPDDDDDLIFEWLGEIHGWLSGGVSESSYKHFMETYAPRIKREV